MVIKLVVRSRGRRLPLFLYGVAFDFAGSGLGQVIGELDVAGDFVPGEVLSGKGGQFFGRRGLTGLGNDEGSDLLAPLGMGNTDDARGRDRRMLFQYIFHFGGVHIFAARSR